jgi:hypothetical protein
MEVREKITTMKNIIIVSTVLVLWSTSVLADEPAPVSVILRIESATSTLFAGAIAVSPCAASASSTPSASGYCAVGQSGLDVSWSSYGGSEFLESISGAGNDYAANRYWNWFADLEYGQTSLDQHVLVAGEELLITLGKMPLRISVSTTTPEIGATTTVSVEEFGFDDAWNPVWLPAASASIVWYGESLPVNSAGIRELVATSTSPFGLLAIKEGFVDSAAISLSPTAAVVSTTTATTTATTDDLSTGPVASPEPEAPSRSGGGSSVASRHSPDVSRALQFLAAQQEADGSFGGDMYTDWAAIALADGSEDRARDKITDYLREDRITSSNVTDYERRAMALEALGINPYTGTSVNYIQKIADAFDGTQIGSSNLVNDDVFALFPLISAGYRTSDDIIEKTAAFIISEQEGNGSWKGSVDMTAAAIQALVLVKSLPEVNGSIAKAREYLQSRQRSDGGFGSGFSTSWALQAIYALGESGSDWLKNDKTPEDYLYSLQQGDGGMEAVSTDASTRIWATAYAIPATLHAPWSSILGRYSRPSVQSRANDADEDEDDEEDSDVIVQATSTPAAAVPATIAEPVIAYAPVQEIVRVVPAETGVSELNNEEGGSGTGGTLATSTVFAEGDVGIADQAASVYVAAAGDSGGKNGTAVAFAVIILVVVGSGIYVLVHKNKS